MSVVPEAKSNIVLTRRNFLASISGAGLALAAPGLFASVAPARDRELSFYNTHTGEKLSATFWSGGDYLDDGIEEISWLLRDHRTGDASSMDPNLLDLLYQLQATLECPGEYHVISGYRSPATNDMLAGRSSGVARRSYHMLGQAIDIRLPEFDSCQLYKAAIAMKAGGAGYYSASNFVHLDVGRVRFW